MIADRPAAVEDPAVPRHWDGDLILGKDGKSSIGTVVEGSTGFLMLIHIQHGVNRVEAVMDGLIAKTAHSQTTCASLIWDQGTEMRRHKEVKIAADIDIYFCDPHSPWQRGSNQNMNGQLGKQFPKEPTSASTAKPTSTTSPAKSTTDPDNASTPARQ